MNPRSSWILLLLLLCWMGCDSQGQQDDFVREAEEAPAGITQTDASGRVVAEDEDDWRTAPFFLGKVRVDPAFPNPTAGEVISVPISILEFNAIQGGLVLRAFDGSGRLLLLDEIQNAADPGANVFRFSPALLTRKGLHRLFVFDRLGEIVSYGDVQLD